MILPVPPPTQAELKDLARMTLDAAIDVMGTSEEAELLDIAAKTYELAGSPEDAEVCRLLLA